MRYLCTNCNYIYNEMIWEVDELIERGTKFDEIRYNFICPVCWENEEFFQEIKEEVIYLDKYSMNIELDHDFFIEFNWNSIEITWNHSMEEEHFIWNIWLYDENKDLVEEIFIEPDWELYANFDISYLDDFEIRVQCNLHWTFAKKFSNPN